MKYITGIKLRNQPRNLQYGFRFDTDKINYDEDENGVCPPSNNSLKPMLGKNIISDSSDSSDTVNFFVIEEKSTYKIITYSFHVQLDNKTSCCNSTRQVFSALTQ